MSSDITQSGTPDGEPTVVAIEEDGTGAEHGVSLPVTEDGTGAIAVSESTPPSPFTPTLRDPDATASETGTLATPRPMDPVDDGETLPCTGPEADRDLILGPPDGGTGGAAIPVAEGQDGATVPAVAPETSSPVDSASLFRDWAVMWSGTPSEVGGDAGLAPSHGEVCLCGETGLAAGEGGADLAS